MQLLNVGGTRHFKTYVMQSPFLMHSSAPCCLHNRSETQPQGLNKTAPKNYMKEYHQFFISLVCLGFFFYFLYLKSPSIFCMAFNVFSLWQECSENAYQIRPHTEFRCSSGHTRSRSFRCLKTIHVKRKASVKHWCPQERGGIRGAQVLFAELHNSSLS